MSIRINYTQTLQRITRVSERVGRGPGGVKLIVVTKGQPLEKIVEVIECGATNFGENYPEESLPKIIELINKPRITWHMIGHLQSRKAGIVSEYFQVLHSLDSVRLAQKLSNQLAVHKRDLPVLLEVNVSGERSKFGWEAANENDWAKLLDEINQITKLRYLRICGLMTMPPWDANSESARPYFKKVRRLRDYLQRAFPRLCFDELSMGSSIDYEVAIEEGATYVRIGHAIMGDRMDKN